MSLSSDAVAAEVEAAQGRPMQQRRRGVELEEALLEAAWQELAEKGYDGITYEGVASRAATSRAVVYRRWPKKPDLVLAAIRHFRLSTVGPTPDTGSLRGDLRTVFVDANQDRFWIALVSMTRLGGYFTETGTGPADIRSSIIDGQPTRLDAIWERAIARGEVDEARVTPRVRQLPFDLFRDQLMMTLRPIPVEDIDAILDEIVLPLVRRVPPPA